VGTEETAGARGDVNGRRVKTRDVIVVVVYSYCIYSS
jgi:hypothetical protein